MPILYFHMPIRHTPLSSFIDIYFAACSFIITLIHYAHFDDDI